MICERSFRLKRNGEPSSICYCRHPELIENYALAIADATQMWEVHHRKEEFYSQKELKERNEYFDVEPEDLIFLTREEHRKIDSANRRLSKSKKGKKRSEEHNRKIIEAHLKRVLCIETGEVFKSIKDAHRRTGINQSNISQACLGKRKTAGGYTWKFYN